MTDTPTPDPTRHEPWCNKNQGPNAWAVECDCGANERPMTDTPTPDDLLADRLRRYGSDGYSTDGQHKADARAAADRIRRLAAEVERLQAHQSGKALAVGKFWERRTPPVGPDYVVLRVYDGQENLHIDGEYAIYRRTEGPTSPEGDRP